MIKITSEPSVLILTPIKNAVAHLGRYFRLLYGLAYPKDRISIGMLESDSADQTLSRCKEKIAIASHHFQRAEVWKHDTGFLMPQGVHRHADHIQVSRRSALAKSRNRLLFNALTAADQWVLWIDVDLNYYPPTILTDMISLDVDVVHPDCIMIRRSSRSSAASKSFDLNAWRDKGRQHMHDLRSEGALVKLDAVGGTMLLVRADAHRQGLIFPTFPYGRQNAKIREINQNSWHGEIETEGFGILAGDMGIQCWGATKLRTFHR